MLSSDLFSNTFLFSILSTIVSLFTFRKKIWSIFWCDLSNNKDKTKLLNELRRGRNRVVDTVTVDEQWPILPNLGDGHVGTYPGTSNIKMMAATNDTNHNTYFLRSVTGNLANTSYISKFKRENVGQSNFQETMITDFQSTHSSSSSDSNYIDISYAKKVHHIGSCLSCIDILVALFFGVMKYKKKN